MTTVVRLCLICLLSIFAAAGCVASRDYGPASDPAKYAAERDQACAAVPGCDQAFLADVVVYEVPSRAAASKLCGSTVSACWVAEDMAIVVVTDCHNLARHEWLHAAYESAGVNTDAHPQFFWDTLRAVELPIVAAGLAKTDPIR